MYHCEAQITQVLAKKQKPLTSLIHNKSKSPIRRVAIDSTGLKVFGDGEWKIESVP
jgi:hypothetical protein